MRFPNGLKDIGPALFEIALTRSQIPLDKVRLNQIGLEAETDEEELFIKLHETLSYILQSLMAKQPELLKQKLFEQAQGIHSTQITSENSDQYTVLYHSTLSLLELYLQQKQFEFSRSQYNHHDYDNGELTE